MGSDEEGKALATPQFWDSRYGKSDGESPTHEWFRTFDALKPFFEAHLFQHRKPDSNPKILHLGSGDSTIPSDLAALGYKNQLCVDFSQVVVDLMSSCHAVDSGIEWRWADIRDMKHICAASVDVAFDKGTMDAMIHGSPWSPPDDVLNNTERYINELHRVLKDDGLFLYVTYRQPHFIRPLLNRDDIWIMEIENLATNESSFDYYGWILRKKSADHTA
ncbi:EEF1A lysine methyltransferase 4 [Fulvia fulva]|uniref:EEF1A lysine methyltransferase 4 n=1 Tax=Passalora fulva TaxID=5499 RepID=A0A9Q8LEG1_PASFU|nr:EEF1A lysine methyltransferase 4 [Fulvia fulva]KAK4616181.1 EEF1A lysine methyltransferase 4 [Fulvia fulva]KAK4617274.1 EEF1A lysine methyltransferase 4 [Fulvia fulva]UJO15889.1 EEF1A lysine methyltransferase 4 [Fulvia fulva]WPV19627.1 EEF1A lysine methyltransferase 4 [Fulvia fulva]WPV34662.1 EEF1A lysine methyltransferase 4 [Fulvia fulva]